MAVMVLAAAPPPPTVESVAIDGVENAYRLVPGLYSGSQPEGDRAFAALARLGVRTIISVDGTQPDVDAAHAHGLRYVHLPVGYDGITPGRAAQLVKAMEVFPGPVYVHCHHGQHRGPAAAAICARVLAGWSGNQARDWLNRAGTSADYPGLFRDVEQFQPPTRAALEAIDALRDLPERAEVPSLVEAMISIDAQWDVLKTLLPTAHGKAPPALTQESATRLAVASVQLMEGFRESARLPEAGAKGAPFGQALEAAAGQAERLSAALRAAGEGVARGEAGKTGSGVLEAARAVGGSCASCHKAYRNQAGR